MAKKNIGPVLALYPCPVIVVGAMADGKPTWTLAAHAGIMAHSHLMVSLAQAHYINRGIRENNRLSVNVVDASWLKEADRMGTVSGLKTDKSECFAWTMGENGAPLINDAKVSIECEVDGN
ncbi:MAG: flavin reductase, partial [Lachnospiraceae bacterium]|nr:flavin reductase [Lachnospiraceae bacterium]